ncbi:MAG TPA: hypothetical protein VIA62_00235 [Thermoanaerobaculia bacterium]|jgi:hypothetical protein|nr:hypothetical protein [Thermoanaerobaculia bacterium]
MKTTAFTVRATEKQSIRWKRAADGEGYPSVGAWLADAADRHLQAVARAGRPVALAWQRFGRFKVRLLDGREVDVPGRVSHPFGIYRGSPAEGKGLKGCGHFVLVYTPTGRTVASLRHEVECKSLAAELARLWVRWDGSEPSEDPTPVVRFHP